ncbi:MAG TPA: porin family protein [Spirosoma sp.]|nr:porin family protein [Spirosoma sp.]
MIKLWPVLILCSLFKLGPVQAQDENPFRIGLKSGLNLAKFSGPNETNSKFLSAYAVGITMQQKISQRVSVDVDVLYSKQGNVVKVSTGNTISNDNIFKYNYLSVPVYIGYSLQELPVIIKAGVQVGFLVKSQYRNPTPDALNVIQYLKKQDFGWLLSTGYSINKHWQAEAKYYQSFSSILKGLNGGNPRTGTLIFNNPGNLKNQVFFFGLSYYL